MTLMELTSQPELVSLENVLTFKPLDLAQLLEPIPPKPIFLDIVRNVRDLGVNLSKVPEVGGAEEARRLLGEAKHLQEIMSL